MFYKETVGDWIKLNDAVLKHFFSNSTYEVNEIDKFEKLVMNYQLFVNNTNKWGFNAPMLYFGTIMWVNIILHFLSRFIDFSMDSFEE